METGDPRNDEAPDLGLFYPDGLTGSFDRDDDDPGVGAAFESRGESRRFSGPGSGPLDLDLDLDDDEVLDVADRRRPRALGIWLAAAGLAALTFLVLQARGGGTGPPQATPSPATSGTIPAAQAALPSPATTTAPGPTATAGAADVTDAAPVLEQLDEALTAWAAFAANGDLTELTGLFDPDGPQHAQLRDEAEQLTVAPLGSYTFARGGAPEAVELDGDVSAVTTAVTFTHRDGGGPTVETYRWHIELRRRDGVWLLHNVTTAAGPTGT